MLRRGYLLISLAASLLVSAVTIGISSRQIYLYEKEIGQRPIYCTHPLRVGVCDTGNFLERNECEKKLIKDSLCELHSPDLKYGTPFKLIGKIDRVSDRIVTSQNNWYSGEWGINYFNVVWNFLIYFVISHLIVLFIDGRRKNSSR